MHPTTPTFSPDDAASRGAAGLVINKMDLAESDELESTLASWAELYRTLGYPVLQTCAISGRGVETLISELHGKSSVITGPSGVGKSSLLNSMDPDLQVRTGSVSEKTRKGKHTTAVAVRYEVAEETFVIDTPGIREIGLWNLEPEELYGYMREMLEPAKSCRFPNCTHDHEPGCGVKVAVDDGEVSKRRYLSYLNMLESLRGLDRGR